MSPSARKLAREKGIRLEDIAGTGPAGRITKKDVVAALLRQAPVAGQAQDGERSRTIAREAHSSAAVDEDTVVPFSPMRTRIAERLSRSQPR